MERIYEIEGKPIKKRGDFLVCYEVIKKTLDRRLGFPDCFKNYILEDELIEGFFHINEYSKSTDEEVIRFYLKKILINPSQTTLVKEYSGHLTISLVGHKKNILIKGTMEDIVEATGGRDGSKFRGISL
jgi:hypothetical protein